MKIDTITPPLAILLGIINIILFKIIIIPGLAVPVIFFMTICDKETNVKAFGWFYIFSCIVTLYVVK